MKLGTLASGISSGDFTLLADLMRHSNALYRIAFLAGASSSGLLARLHKGPATLDALAADMATPATRGALEAWLDVGVKLGLLKTTPGGYALHKKLARRLAEPQHDAAVALVEEMATLHVDLLRGTPRMAREGRLLSLADSDGALIARSSRTLEPLVGEAVDDFVPRSGAPRLLEVGCGSGTYIRRAATRNPKLTAVGLELQPDVAAAARANIKEWGLADRVTIEEGDIRARPPEATFDLVTLHNNVYYFPVDEREALFQRLRMYLRPGGRLLVTTACRGGSAALGVLDLWACATEGCGPLPDAEIMIGDLEAAGFPRVKRKALVRGERFFSFVATLPEG